MTKEKEDVPQCNVRSRRLVHDLSVFASTLAVMAGSAGNVIA